jgi:hypothetical protein
MKLRLGALLTLLGVLVGSSALAGPAITTDLDVTRALSGRVMPVRANYASMMIEWQRIRHVFSSKQKNLEQWDKKYFRDHFLQVGGSGVCGLPARA